jgi:hypothetical protein
MESVRLNVAQELAPRNAVNESPDEFTGKDGLLRNCYKESTPLGEMVVKRPGLELNTDAFVAGCAQGSFLYNDIPYFIVGGIIYGLRAESPAGGSTTTTAIPF